MQCPKQEKLTQPVPRNKALKPSQTASIAPQITTIYMKDMHSFEYLELKIRLEIDLMCDEVK